MKHYFLLLTSCLLLCSVSLADRTEHSPVHFGSGSALTFVPNISIQFGSNRLQLVGEPTIASDAATKNYVDTQFGAAPTSFLGLTDTPNSYSGQASKAVFVKGDESGLEFNAVTATFLGLTDTPSSYSGQASKAVFVKGDESGLEFDAISTTIVRGFSFGLKRSSGVPVAKLPMYWTCPYTGTITAWNITVDAGTITVKVWKKASGTAHPTASDSINSSGLSLSSNTHIHSTTLTDFTTTAVTAGDTFAVEVTAASGVSDVGGSIEITQ